MTRLDIVVPLIGPENDPDLVSERALPVAQALAGATGAATVLLSVVERSFQVGALANALAHEGSREDAWLASLKEYLESAASTFPSGNIQVVIRSGHPATEIEAETRNVANPLVVMASHGRVGMERMLLGSVAFRLIHNVDCPVVLVREMLPNAFSVRNLLIPLDGSPAAESALERSLDLLNDLPLRLHLLHVVEPLHQYYGFAVGLIARGYQDAANTWANTYLQQVSDRLTRRGYEVTTEVRHGFAVDQIAEAAIERRVDLVVMGTQGSGTRRRILFGLVTERTLHETVLPLLVVRPSPA